MNPACRRVRNQNILRQEAGGLLKIKHSTLAYIWVIFSFLSLLPLPLFAAATNQPGIILYSIKKDGKYGYIDQEGKVIIEPQYESAAAFSEGLAQVRWDGKYGYIDTAGKMVIPNQYHFAASFSEGLARVRATAGAKMGYMDTKGKMVIPPAYDQADDFHEGLARVGLRKKFGFINKKGDLVIPLQYDTAQGFSQGLALVKRRAGAGTDYFYIDTKGKKALDPDCRSAGNFKEGLAYFRDSQAMGYLDLKGKVAIAPKFEEARAFSEGLAAVKLSKLWGYIDKTGQWVIEPRFESAGSEFKEGLAFVKAKEQYGYIDTSGQFVIRPQFENCGNFINGLAWGSIKDETGTSYINKEGRYVWTETNFVSGNKELNFATSQIGFSLNSPWALKDGWLIFSSDVKDSYCDNVYPKRVYDSFSYSAEVRWDGGAVDSGYGLFFLYTDKMNHYSFDITGDKRFRVRKQVNGKWSEIYPWKKCARMEKTNLLQVACWPGTVKCYINSVLVADIREPDGSNLHGYTQVALFSESGIQCSFNNIILQELTAALKESYRPGPLPQVWDFSAEDAAFQLNPWTMANGTLNFNGGEKGLSYNNVPADRYLSDFTLDLDAAWIGGDTRYGYGLIFRYKDSQNYYDFKVSPKGYYRLAKRSPGGATELVKWTKNDSITGGANRIKIICQDANIKCYVNNTLVVNLDDEQPDGGAGKQAEYTGLGVTASGAISCAFDNYTVTESPVIWTDK
jgi:hypothetical protein